MQCSALLFLYHSIIEDTCICSLIKYEIGNLDTDTHTAVLVLILVLAPTPTGIIIIYTVLLCYYIRAQGT
jgi:hypothetical protein